MSTIKANDLTNVAGGIPTVKGQQLIPTAWVNFNGTGTVAIRDSENVSSITDVTTGQYIINFTTANANYAVSGMSQGSGYTSSYLSLNGNYTTSTIGIRCISHTGSYIDSPDVMVNVMGGQA
jgi:hypothetical protein